MTSRRMFLSASVMLTGACATQHAPAAHSAELACDPSELRSVWWTEGGPTILDASADLLVNGSGTHLLVTDVFRPVALRIEDGMRVESPGEVVGFRELSGVRFAREAIVVDSMGRHDLGGATEVMEIGRSAPLVTIPWIVAPSEVGYSQVVAHVGPSSHRVYLIEHAARFGGERVGLWLRSLDAGGGSETRVDLSPLVPLADSYTMAVDEVHGVVFVVTGEQSEAPASVTRVDLLGGEAASAAIDVGIAVPFLGHAHVEPPTAILDVAISNDGSLLLLTGRDGQLRALDALTLAEASSTPVGVLAANGDTYLPSLRSPVGFSARDTYVGLILDDGQLAIIERSTWTPVATLASAAPRREVSPPEDSEARAMSMRFLSDGLLVVSDRGVERFACPD